MLPKGPYKPSQHEAEIYKFWEKKGYFNPDNSAGKETYTIMMPPPNVTGVLHIGHALTLTIQDILIRFHRMQGKKTLWLPGTDHAAIATQSKVEKMLYKETGKNRHDLGREKFLKKVEEFAQKSHDTIVEQTKKMGASCDWTREAYTLDEARNLAVCTAFKKMYDLGLIYQGERLVNWDPKMQTTVSDDEVEYIEEKAPFYYFKYGPFTIATSRPETKFGDKYVVMHPDDKRYKKYKHGQKIEVDWITGKITATILKDKVIDKDFGTGVMTITPWHDAVDFDLAEKYNLDKEQIIDLKGKLMPIAGDCAGLNIRQARKKIVEKLKEKGLLVKVEENYIHRVATNSRGGGMIEPQIMKQWFISVDKKFKLPKSNLKSFKAGDEVTLKELMRKVVENKEIKIIPKHFSKTYFHWIDKLRDWCISRQIWYGHQIPAYYCLMCEDKKSGVKMSYKFDEFGNSENIYSVKRKNARPIAIGDRPEKCPICGCSEKSKIMQDPDTLDTWFSSGLWTFSTLGWPKNTEDLKLFHPTSVLETAYDILFFWVARMILMTTCLLGEVPFYDVFIHGIVRDAEKKKMSKSSGNALDPMELTEKYGTDAMRMALIFGTGQGSDIALQESKFVAHRKFTNKIWNASRFVLMNIDDSVLDISEKELKLNAADKDILKKLDLAIKNITQNIEKYMFHEAAQEAYHFFWDEFCDKCIENTKDRLNGEDEINKKTAQFVLHKVLLNSLKLLHPFVPFITELIWKELPKQDDKALIVAGWPKI